MPIISSHSIFLPRPETTVQIMPENSKNGDFYPQNRLWAPYHLRKIVINCYPKRLKSIFLPPFHNTPGTSTFIACQCQATATGNHQHPSCPSRPPHHHSSTTISPLDLSTHQTCRWKIFNSHGVNHHNRHTPHGKFGQIDALTSALLSQQQSVASCQLLVASCQLSVVSY